MKSKWFRWRSLLAYSSIAILLVLPLFTKLHHLAGYYAFIVFITLFSILRIAFEKQIEERFYLRWQKARRRGFWLNFVIGSLEGLLFMVLVVAAGQFFGRGVTPVEIANQLSPGEAIVIICLLLFFSLLVGVARWRENEKRYYRIYYRKKYQ